MKTFTIITPNLNMGMFLEDTIKSVLINLKYDDKYYIIDGGSTDNSISIIKKYENKITGWISEKDAGYSHAIYKGFLKAESNYMCWINSGDILLEGSLTFAKDCLERFDVDLIYGNDFLIDSQGRILRKSIGKMGQLKFSMLYGGWTPLQDACFWRKSLYDRVGGISKDLKYAADFDLFLRFSLYGKVKYIPSEFSAFRLHQGQKSIAFHFNYVEERNRCIKRELRNLNNPMVIKCLLISWFWFYVHLLTYLRKILYVRSKFYLTNINSITINYKN